jgi:hypothetical protein
MKLNHRESVIYNKNFKDAIKTLPPGVYYIKDFFENSPSVPRIARKFYEDVTNKVYPNVSLKKKYSCDGYYITEFPNQADVIKKHS